MEPVDLTNLRTMIDHDAELEQELVVEFHRGVEASLAGLASSMEDAAAESWRDYAHALKGIALNFGAAPMGEVAKIMQESSHASMTDKRELLESLHRHYAAVRAFLQA